MDTKLYTRDELAKMFRVSYNTIQLWEKSGEIRPIKIGGTYRYTQQELDRILANKGEGEK